MFSAKLSRAKKGSNVVEDMVYLSNNTNRRELPSNDICCMNLFKN